MRDERQPGEAQGKSTWGAGTACGRSWGERWHVRSRSAKTSGRTDTGVGKGLTRYSWRSRACSLLNQPAWTLADPCTNRSPWQGRVNMETVYNQPATSFSGHKYTWIFIIYMFKSLFSWPHLCFGSLTSFQRDIYTAAAPTNCYSILANCKTADNHQCKWIMRYLQCARSCSKILHILTHWTLVNGL